MERLSRAGPLRRWFGPILWVPLLVLAILGASALLGLVASPIALLLLVGAIGAILLLRWPGLCLVAMVALSATLPLEFGTGTEVNITPPVFLIGLMFAVWFVDSLRRGSIHLPASRTTLPLLLFTGSGLLSLVAGTVYWDLSVPRAGNLVLVQLAQWAIFLLSAAVFLVTGELGREKRWLRYATWVFLILAGIVMLEPYLPWLHQTLGWNQPERAKSSMFLTWLAALSISQLLFNRDLKLLAKLALVVLWTASAYVVWFMWSEWTSGLLPFTVATAAVVWLWFWRRNRAMAIGLLVVGLLLAVIAYPIVFELSGGEREFDTSLGGRLALYRTVLDVVKEHPLLGLGPVAYRHYGYTHSLWMGPGGAYYWRVFLASHNNYIDIYAQMGLVGLGLFLWFLAELVAVGWKLKDRFAWNFEDAYVAGVLGGLAGTLVAMLLVDWFLPFIYNVGFKGFRTSALAWMFLGGLVALEQVSRSRANAEMSR